MSSDWRKVLPFAALLIVYRFQLSFHNVELGVGDDKYVAVHVA